MPRIALQRSILRLKLCQKINTLDFSSLSLSTSFKRSSSTLLAISVSCRAATSCSNDFLCFACWSRSDRNLSCFACNDSSSAISAFFALSIWSNWFMVEYLRLDLFYFSLIFLLSAFHSLSLNFLTLNLGFNLRYRVAKF